MIDFGDLFGKKSTSPSETIYLKEQSLSARTHKNITQYFSCFQVTKRNVTSCSLQNCGDRHTRVAYEQ